eukprot:CAMPEP_0178405248 /NCGR_PEP_ID=MMETSP0689_2-20121128/18302_1 /TAXON_ID=160604 /ORGANISM="Amphidinium massartii, Strain CS-259" /LENGTH=344 /DNA_ID=CAMNT_0020026259 /DNA_START=186 /DNA_END=1220 /DNA_ORIENTATION=-
MEDVEANGDGFDPGHCSVEERAYGIFILLACRTQMQEQEPNEAPPPEVATLKFVESRVIEAKSAPPPRHSHHHHDRSDQDDSDDELISEGEPVEASEPAAWPGKKGSWWKVLNSLQEDVIVRAGVSLQSKEVQRVRPGDIVQQAGQARMLVKGRAKGCVRVPVQPTGWVTADAQKAGGPKYLIRSEAPHWQAVYSGSGQAAVSSNGSTDAGSVIMRAESALDSEEVGILQCGAVVAQAGPFVTRPDGIVRMPVVARVRCHRTAAIDSDSDDSYDSSTEIDIHQPAKSLGWVTLDASDAGGPLFFKSVPAPGGGPSKNHNHNNHNHNNNHNNHNNHKKKWARQSD